MNANTGEIQRFEDEGGLLKAMKKAELTNQLLLPIGQRENIMVSLKDHTSVLGRLKDDARRDRSKYTPHIGTKQKERGV